MVVFNVNTSVHILVKPLMLVLNKVWSICPESKQKQVKKFNSLI